MISKTKTIAGTAILIALAGCMETRAPSDGMSNNALAPAGMREECIVQATRLTGVPAKSIVPANPIEVGPDRRAFIGLTIDGASYGCRIEDDGSYTVFNQYAN